MTKAEFYLMLKATGTKFKLSYADGVIRSEEQFRCPICSMLFYLKGKAKSNLDYVEAALEIGLNRKDAEDIAAAADGLRKSANPVRQLELVQERKLVMEACGL